MSNRVKCIDDISKLFSGRKLIDISSLQYWTSQISNYIFWTRHEVQDKFLTEKHVSMLNCAIVYKDIVPTVLQQSKIYLSIFGMVSARCI